MISLISYLVYGGPEGYKHSTVPVVDLTDTVDLGAAPRSTV